MAKKAKAPLTPEQAEVKAIKKAKRGENATRFFAVLLAAVLTVGVVFTGKHFAEKNVPEAPVAGTNTEEPDNNDPFGTDEPDTPANPDEPDKPADPANPEDPSKPAANKLTKAEAVKLLNDATKAAANAKSYMLNRDSDFTKEGISLMLGSQDMTPAANQLIGRFDKSGTATVESVVGSLFGRGHEKGLKHTKGKTGDESFLRADGSGIWSCEKFLVKGMALTESDLADFTDKGNSTYVYKLKPESLPEKDNKSMMHRFTNDFASKTDASDALANETKGLVKLSDDSVVNYTNVQIMASFKDGKLVNLQMFYRIEVEVTVTAIGIKIPGSGKLELKSEYYDFVY